VTPKNSLVYQSVDIAPNRGAVEMSIHGSGCALLQVKYFKKLLEFVEMIYVVWSFSNV
jgi:hypothetical protein